MINILLTSVIQARRNSKGLHLMLQSLILILQTVSSAVDWLSTVVCNSIAWFWREVIWAKDIPLVFVILGYIVTGYCVYHFVPKMNQDFEKSKLARQVLIKHSDNLYKVNSSIVKNLTHFDTLLFKKENLKKPCPELEKKIDDMRVKILEDLSLVRYQIAVYDTFLSDDKKVVSDAISAIEELRKVVQNVFTPAGAMKMNLLVYKFGFKSQALLEASMEKFSIILEEEDVQLEESML